ncbi:carotenoid biosynthesis protein [Pendulispora albinea]|uniref:Carotenoid biosynthesis protein n=1 Tax=Pendulispora albinea TaxID=2741071 RepID=A0ABZ2M4X6_9BACT
MSSLSLLWGSVVHRPYVYAFLTCFLVFAVRHLGVRRMLLFWLPTHLVAFACEYSSTRNGFPFGPYRYFDDTRGQELWISNVPFFDSLSFVFLSYFSFVLASALVGDVARPVSRAIPWIGGVLMTILDVVIDPVALQGEKWFLGRIYDYPYRGFYFGVTAANFAGWFFLGFVSQALFQLLRSAFGWARAPLPPTGRLFVLGCFGVYAGIFLFNLTMTVIIGDHRLAMASAIVTAGTLAAIGLGLRQRSLRRAPDLPSGAGGA